MKASFSVAVWPILDPLFLVLVGTTSGRLKIHLPGRHLPRNGLSSIAVFAMLCEHKSIWSYFFRHFAEPFLSGSESHQSSPPPSFGSEAKNGYGAHGAFHICTVLSSLAEAIRLPFGDQATAYTVLE